MAATRWLAERPVPLDHGGPADISFEPFDEPNALIERLELMAARHADKVAVDDGNNRITYEQLIRRTRALATLIDAETPAGKPVAILMRYTATFPVVLLACIAAGRLFVPIDAGHPEERRRAILAASGAAVLIVEKGVDVGNDLPDLPRMSVDPNVLGDGRWPAGRFDPYALGGVTYTSGSTGKPKGFAWSIAGLLAAVAETTHANHLNASDRYIALGSLSSAGAADALLAILNGATLRILEVMQAGVGELLRVLGEERITILSFVPAILRSVLQMEGAPEAFRHLRILDLYGDATLASDIELFREKLPSTCHIRLILGSMEAGVIFHWFVPRDFAEPALSVPCGYLAAGKEVAVLDPNGRSVIPGEEGEIVVRSRVLALGAWQDGRLTNGPFLADPDDPAKRIFPMGDLIRMRGDGLAEFVGRRDRQVKVRGKRADLGEVEAALRLHSAVTDVAVVAVAGESDTEIIAYCVFRERDEPAPAALRSTVSAETAEHMVPSRIFQIDVIPRLPNWKPDLVQLSERAVRDLDAECTGIVGVSDDIDPEVLAAVELAWAATLEERGKPSVSWSSSGGDSLEELQLIHRIEDALGIELPHLLEPEYTTADLARAIVAYITSAEFATDNALR
jgi:non-ribosomal peptide synthetase component F